MANNDGERFRAHLLASGLTDAAVTAAWPQWWSEAADASPSAQAELRFSVARKLGIDPRSLFDEVGPRFVWDDAAKYKNFKGDVSTERPAISAFGTSIGQLLAKLVPTSGAIEGIVAADLRKAILHNQPFVRLLDLLGFCWSVGVPVIHLRVHPLSAKRMCAMTVRTGDRYSILLAKDSDYPAITAFHLAHEIAHMALGHLAPGSSIVDMEDPTDRTREDDPEELDADRYALELLTGRPDTTVANTGPGKSGKQLAAQVLQIGPQHGIEPGTLALCYGYSTKDWPTAHASMKHIYTTKNPVWSATNQIAKQQLDWSRIDDDMQDFLRAVMGGI